MAFPGFLVARLVMFALGQGGVFLFALMGVLNSLAVFLAFSCFSLGAAAEMFNGIFGPLFVVLGALGGAMAWRSEQRTAAWGAERRPPLPLVEPPL